MIRCALKNSDAISFLKKSSVLYNLDQKSKESFNSSSSLNSSLLFWGSVSFMVCLSHAGVFAVTSETMKDAITGLEKDLWGGAMHVLMVSGCVFGVAMSVFRQSLMPAGVGVGAALAGNFLKTWIDKGYGALI
jgi:hypothetical protein